MSDVKYILFCEICGYKRLTDGTDIGDLKPYKRSSIQSGTPKLDPLTKKIVVKDNMKLPKQFKCPKCGRLIQAKKYETNNEEHEQNLDSGSKIRAE